MKIQYILPGKFQTDHLEARFSQYQQLSGDQYNISIQQVFESEKNYNAISFKNLKFNQKYIKIDFKNLQEPNWDEVTEELKLDVLLI